MKKRIIRTGNSAAATLPSEFMRTLNPLDALGGSTELTVEVLLRIDPEPVERVAISPGLKATSSSLSLRAEGLSEVERVNLRIGDPVEVAVLAVKKS